MRATLPLVAVALLVGVGDAYPYFGTLIPNGQAVPHPCQDNATWLGVGHYNAGGGGARNAFGVDFHAAGNQWTAALCQKDSDGDGRTNGEELGDPGCEWTPGKAPRSTFGITHPGVCEPVSSDTCRGRSPGQAGYQTQGQWTDDVCGKATRFTCPELDAAQGVQELDLRIPVTPVPARETTYVCATFEFPDTSLDYHVIASNPIINNTNVMHHMLLYGCHDDMEIHGPKVGCNMGACGSLLLGWAVGHVGNCLHEDAGIRLGKTGFKKMMIQYHWNNPQHIDSYIDSSGMKLFYTPVLRNYDMAMLMIGQRWLEIPPGVTDAVADMECTSTCTNNLMKGDINIVQAFNHMHLTGFSQSVEHRRNDQHLRWFTNESHYSYDSPVFYDFAKPITVSPGDVLRTTCHFATPGKQRTIFYGDGTQEEMCYGFLTFYPLQNMPQHQCVNWKTLNLNGCDAGPFHGCNLDLYKNATWFSQTQLYKTATTLCDAFGPCLGECKAAVRQAIKNEPCISHGDDLWTALKWGSLRNHDAGRNFLAHVESCVQEEAVDGALAAARAQAEAASVDTPLGSENQFSEVEDVSGGAGAPLGLDRVLALVIAAAAALLATCC